MFMAMPVSAVRVGRSFAHRRGRTPHGIEGYDERGTAGAWQMPDARSGVKPPNPPPHPPPPPPPPLPAQGPIDPRLCLRRLRRWPSAGEWASTLEASPRSARYAGWTWASSRARARSGFDKCPGPNCRWSMPAQGPMRVMSDAPAASDDSDLRTLLPCVGHPLVATAPGQDRWSPRVPARREVLAAKA